MIDDADLESHSAQIVASLGGINKILKDYIRITTEHEQTELLNQSQIEQILNIIAGENIDALATVTGEEHDETIWDRLYRRGKLKDDTFHLDKSDTLLHYLCSDSDLSDRICTFLHSKIAVFFVSVIDLAWVASISLDRTLHQDLGYFLTEMLIIFTSIFYFIMLILTCNVNVFLLVISGFDFWLKLYYGITLYICNALWMYHSETGFIVIFVNCAAAFLVISVIAVSLIEGYATSWRVSFGVGLFLSLLTSTLAVRFTFLSEYIGLEEVQLEIIPGSGMYFELLAYVGSAMRIIALFMWKQTLMSAYTRGQWCICIYLSPQIKWLEKRSDETKGRTTDVPK